MATAENTTVKLYRGVPLTKDGTEVLFLSGAAAEGVLSAYAAFTDTKYYYARENRGAIQIESAIAPLEGCNYVGFQNLSHGGKWYFGFIDRLVYINDKNTQVEFTIDPFTTYLDDCTELDDYFVLRNTPKTDTRAFNLQDDFLPKTEHSRYFSFGSYSLAFNTPVVYYAASQITTPAQIGTTGIKVGNLTDQVLEAIQQNGGAIISASMFPGSWISSYGSGFPMAFPITVIGGNPSSWLLGDYVQKIRTGVYLKPMLVTSQGSKTYNLEQFANPTNIQFQVMGLTVPSPALFVYPKNYDSIAENVAEGVMIKAPGLPITANAVYTNAQNFSDVVTGLTTIAGGAIAGFAKGGLTGAAIGGGAAAVGAVLNYAKNVEMTNFKPPTIYGSGEPMVNLNNELFCECLCAAPLARDLDRIDRYLRYFGYAQNAFSTCIEVFPSGVNMDDGAYLQTGSEMYGGSEMAGVINDRISAGIKIRKTL